MFEQVLHPDTIILPPPELNLKQLEAVEDILDWIKTSSNYYLLSGAAGTGKTFCARELAEQIQGKIIFTAPTNKATKVLRVSLTSDEYKPECRTIYSLLGLKMETSGAVKKIKSPDNPVNLKKISLVIVDEASMVNQQLLDEIEKAVKKYDLKILFLGDENQLPPVNEAGGLVWKMIDSNISTLYQVMRFDNQILTLADKIKKQVNHPAPSIKLYADNGKGEGIWLEKPLQFKQALIKAAQNGDFTNPIKLTKAIAWRNATVATLNQLIRSQIFLNASEEYWLVGDRIILTGPASDTENKPIGHTDDEGTVEGVEEARHPIYSDFICWKISVITDENKRISLWVLHKKEEFDFRFRQTFLANKAKLQPRKWKDYWEFTDSFHRVQHGYAITAHRAQGSTYDSCYVVWNDILLNRNRGEAFRCLYVATTRAKKKLILGGL